MRTKARVEGLEVYLVNLEQEIPYLGPLSTQENVNAQGYFIRKKNRTVYPRKNRSLVLRIWTDGQVEGWGETYGLVVPTATAAIIKELFAGFVIGRDPFEVERIYEDLYDMMRVRGYSGGYYHDALAAIDIALWDLVGKLSQQALSTLLGGMRHSSIPAYVSGLPEANLEKRVILAQSWYDKGFDKLKFALPAADQGPVREIQALRKALGEKAYIACDMHWARTQGEALELARGMAPYRPWFLEAPVQPEDIAGLSALAAQTDFSIAVGEEWRTVHEAKLRIDRRACHIIQPEMGHTGVTQFMRICQYAQAHNLAIIPHATIGAGIFLAASLQASATLSTLLCHEFQHSLFDAFLPFVTGDMSCQSGFYQLPTGYGIGVEPSHLMKSNMTLL